MIKSRGTEFTKQLHKMQDSQWKPTEVTKLVIIGGGIAGLAAAKTLEAADCEDYILLEAQEKIGGRIDSLPWNENWIECGAQWLHGEDSELAKVCRHYELLSEVSSRKGRGTYLRDDSVRMDERLIKDVNGVVQSALEECKNPPGDSELGVPSNAANIGRALRSKLRKYLRMKDDPLTVRDMREEIFDWNIRSLMVENSCFTLDELSFKYWDKYEPADDRKYLNFKAGYSSIIKFLSQGLNQRNIRLSCPVETIEWNQSINRDDVNQANTKPVVVTLADRRHIFADCVIVTCSLGFLKDNYRKMFIPTLPLHLSQGIDSLGFGLTNKVFLDFGEPWWDHSSEGFQLIWSKNSKRIFSIEKLATWTRDLTGFDVLKNHRAVLVGWVGGRGAHVIEMLSERQIAEDCVALLKHFLRKEDIPSPKRCKRTRWSSNKYIRGAYSHISVNCDANAVTPGILSKPVWCTVTHRGHDKCIPIIMLAGEATHEHNYGTTHGAFETGVKQAKIFLKYQNEKKR